jgi:hypothetical protein
LMVNSSTTVRHLSFWPLAQWSNTKSYAQTWLRPVAGRGRGRLAAKRRRGRFLGTWRPVGAHSVPFASEQDSNTTVAVARVLR